MKERRGEEAFQAQRKGGNMPILAILNPQGGAGKTTLATKGLIGPSWWQFAPNGSPPTPR